MADALVEQPNVSLGYPQKVQRNYAVVVAGEQSAATPGNSTIPVQAHSEQGGSKSNRLVTFILPERNQNGNSFVATLRISSELTEVLRQMQYRIFFGFGRTFLSRVRHAAAATRTGDTEAMGTDPQSGNRHPGSDHQKQ